MLVNATAEASGRTLACRLFEMTDDPGMKDMRRFRIARDTMHQQQWLAFPQSQENKDFSYVFLSCTLNDQKSPRKLDRALAAGELGRAVVRSTQPRFTRFAAVELNLHTEV
ncbi:MAG: Mn-containing catalase [Bryobacterales bacterium]|nr:Mn-containing catalase [Bryobacterales bacterium]